MAVTAIHGGRQIQSGTITNDRLAAFTSSVDAGSQKITNLANGTTSGDAVNYSQLQAAINNQDLKASVQFASTGSETYTISGGSVTQISGTTFGGGSPAVNDRILVKNAPAATGAGVADTGTTGTSQPANGIYTVTSNTTNLSVARAGDADAAAELTDGATVWVDGGTLADTQWTLTNSVTTVGTTAAQFTRTGGAVIAPDGTSLTNSGNTWSIAAGGVTLAKMASLAANSVIGNNTGSGATPTALTLSSTGAASSVAYRDSNGNTKANNYARGVTTTATAGGTTTLTVSSTQFQQFTGSSTQTVVLPDATTLPATGYSFIISNQSSGTVTVNANGGGLIRTVAANTNAVITNITNATAAGTWDPGTTATSTGLTASNFVTRETPSGSVNGSNTAFTLANTPTAGTERVYLNGILQEPGAGNDYTISGATITYLTAPVSGDKVRVSYMK